MHSSSHCFTLLGPRQTARFISFTFRDLPSLPLHVPTPVLLGQQFQFTGGAEESDTQPLGLPNKR